MACPALNDYTLPVLKDRNTSHQHPWEKNIKAYYYNRIKRAHNTIKNPVYPEPEENKNNLKDRIKFTVIGIRSSKEFLYCANLVKGMHKYRAKTFDVPSIKGLSTTQWPSAFKELTLNFGGSVYCLTTPVIVLKNGEFFGGDQELKELMESRYIYRLCLDYRKEFMQDFYRYVKSAGRPFVYLDIAINEKPIGLLIFMLYSDIVPKTCENFLRLCNIRKKGYPYSPVHRIVKDGWIQCGGYFLEGSNLDCENFIVPHDRRGVLGMCNDGRNVDCSTQFFVLLQPANWMAYKYVAFGQLVEGEEVLKQIENEPTFYESPTSSIIIERAGILNLDCKDITINKRVREYINKHIEDLIETQEFVWELLMQRLWAEIKARRISRKEIHKSENKGGDIIPFRGSFVSDLIPIFENDSDDKENNEFAVESYPSLYEMSEYHISEDKMEPLHVKFTRPFYLPLTDVPYPDEKDSTFDLKKFLQGDYCLESDLNHNLDRHEQHKDVLKIDYSQLPSDLFLFDKEDEASLSDGSEMSASEEEEIINYCRQNVDRISFAGDVIRTIGIKGKGGALPTIFEGIRKSKLPILSDEYLKKLRHISLLKRRQFKRSIIPQFNDEDIRKLRLASLRERGPPNSPFHIGSKNHQQRAPETTYGTKTSEQKKKETKFDKRRYSIVDPEKMSIIDEEISSKTSEEDASELDKMIQRQSEFAKDKTRFESFQKDISSKEGSTGSIESVDLKKAKIQETSKTSKSKVQIKEINEVVKRKESSFRRRLTGFVRGIPDHDDEDDDDSRGKKYGVFLKAPAQTLTKISETDEKVSTTSFEAGYESFGEKESKPASELDTKPRQTIFAKDLASVKSYQKDFSSREPSSETIKSVDLEKSKVQKTSNKSNVTIDESVKIKESSIKRRPTGFVHGVDLPDDDADDDGRKKKQRESTFLKDLEKSPYFDKDAPLPTLKNYRPLSETIPNTKNMFLTMGNVLHAELDDAKEVLLHCRSEFMKTSDSLLRMPRLSFERKAEPKISSEYVVTLHELEKKHKHTPMGRVRLTRRPVITVEDYRKMNQERLEKIKKEEESRKTENN